jgi:hypothetical protein
MNSQNARSVVQTIQRNVYIDVKVKYRPYPGPSPGYHWSFHLQHVAGESNELKLPKVIIVDPSNGMMEISHVEGPVCIHYNLNPDADDTPTGLRFAHANISTSLANGATVIDQIASVCLDLKRTTISIEYADIHKEIKKFGLILVAIDPDQPYFAICSPDPQVICNQPPHS